MEHVSLPAPPPIPSKDYARQHRALWPELRLAIERAFFEDDPILGAAVERFEDALARAHRVRAAVGVASGMAALELALVELGVSGGEVITAAHNFPGTVSAIVLAGAVPVLADVEEETGLLDPARVAEVLSPRTRAILPVHLYGHPADLDRLGALAREGGALLVEDGAQAHGARLGDRPIGGFGAACALSFHPSKNLGAFGDGGAVLTDDESLAERLRVARNLGKTSKYEFGRVARNEKLDTLQAAILEVKLRHLDAWIERRRALAARYTAGLEGVGDLRLPRERPGARHAFHLYVVRTRRRAALQAWLAQHGVRAGLHYPLPVHRQPAHAARFSGQRLPVAERFAAEVLTLPLSHEHEDDEIARVIELVRRFFDEGAR